MSGSRIKTLVIATLALINIVFLAVIVINAITEAQIERQAKENICAVLGTGGITIDPASITSDDRLRAVRTARADEAEASIAHAVLGPTTITVQGVIHQYESVGRGIAEFFSGGDFEIRVDSGTVKSSGGTVRTVSRLLRDMKLETSEVIHTGRMEGDMVTVVCSYRGASIFNCTIDFVFSGDSLSLVKGRYVTGFEPLEESASMPYVGTALLGFLSAVKDEEREDVTCTRIDSVESGYHQHVVGAFGGELAPVWLITTDMGSYYVFFATGEILPVV